MYQSDSKQISGVEFLAIHFSVTLHEELGTFHNCAMLQLETLARRFQGVQQLGKAGKPGNVREFRCKGKVRELKKSKKSQGKSENYF